MNLELLDPFGRQIPDRVDATLQLAPSLHFRHHHHDAAPAANNKQQQQSGGANDNNNNNNSSSSKSENKSGEGGSGGAGGGDVDPEWKAAYHVQFNRRGTYLAVGYASGATAVHNVLTRTLSALYRPNDVELCPQNVKNGVTAVTWSKRSRSLLTGAAGDATVTLLDTTHPEGPEEACLSLFSGTSSSTTMTNPSGGGHQQQQQQNDSSTAAAGAAASNNSSNAAKDKDTMSISADGAGGGGGGGVDDNNDGDARRPQSKREDDDDDEDVDDLNDDDKKKTTSAKKKTTKKNKKATTASGSSSSTTRSGSSSIPPHVSLHETKHTSFRDPDGRFVFMKDRRALDTVVVGMGQTIPGQQNVRPAEVSDNLQGLKKFHAVAFDFPAAVGGTLQVHPRYETAGLAALVTGTLYLFWFHPSVWVHGDGYTTPKVIIVPVLGINVPDTNQHIASASSSTTLSSSGDTATTTPSKQEGTSSTASSSGRPSRSSSRGHQGGNSQDQHQQQQHFVTCAAFDPAGNAVYAATKDGTVLGLDVSGLFDTLVNNVGKARTLPKRLPRAFFVAAPGTTGASAWHLLMSRNGKYLVVNSADGALRLYETTATNNAATTTTTTGSSLTGTPPSANLPPASTVTKPCQVFQDVVSRVKFASCDVSGDGEYLVGGANGDDNKYELYIWNTTTAALMDKLTGSLSVQLYSVAWHPTRSWLAVATSDGLVDVWGPRLSWTSFAPDFQALPANVEYVEREDEFDQPITASTTTKTPAVAVTARSQQDEGKPATEQRQQQDDPRAMATIDAAVAETDSSIPFQGVWTPPPRRALDPTGHLPKGEDAFVDVMTVERVPVFDSDSEPEEEVFSFETRVKNVLAQRGGGSGNKGGGGTTGGAKATAVADD